MTEQETITSGARLIVTPLDATAKGSYVAFKRIRKVQRIAAAASTSEDFAAVFDAQDEMEAILRQYVTVEGGTFDEALDELSINDFYRVFTGLLGGEPPLETTTSTDSASTEKAS